MQTHHEILKKVETAFNVGTREARREIITELNFLVENRIPEASDFFLKLLEQKNAFWSGQALTYFTGASFHLKNQVALSAIEIIKDSTADSSLRQHAAAFLGHGLKEIDVSLIDLLDSETEKNIKDHAFGAIVEIQTDFWTGRNAYEQADSGVLEPTLENAQIIVNEWKQQHL